MNEINFVHKVGNIKQPNVRFCITECKKYNRLNCPHNNIRTTYQNYSYRFSIIVYETCPYFLEHVLLKENK